ncbi:hypothetical protein J6V86_01965 [bacterium]|nr:hypothetical protein [bacterium]
MEEDDDDEIVINTPISVNPNDKNEKEEMPNNKKIKKNSATGEIITDEEIQLEQ